MDDWQFEVHTSPHDDVKEGVLCTVRSWVVVSAADYPTYASAYDVAACLAVAVHGGMPTRVVRWV